ncbi:hypothetical protein [Archangium sp.]|uniref:hypothetical protein n=1 Tax=Archangium sp. TaxID=1872627 RepID=UPI002D61E256|nr:hypothetical protein [Archangium sp.]HYO55789.1 hypothetical protein [Archangium sp.]
MVVGPYNDQLHILGLARRVKHTDGGKVLVFSAPEPGFVVLLHAGEEIFRYERGYFIPPEQKTSLWTALSNEGIIRSALEETCKSLILELRGGAGEALRPEPLEETCKSLILELPQDILFPQPAWNIVDIFFQLINTMVSTRHGGIIATLASQGSEKRPAYPIARSSRTLLSTKLREFAVARRRSFELRSKHREDSSRTEEERMALKAEKETKKALDSTIENIGRLTAMDNALLIGPDLEVLGAGFPIPTPQEGTPEVHEALNLQGEPRAPYNISQHGSRHRAAACFAHQNPGGLVFIVSQDGPLRCMLRPSAQQEVVLLWNLRLTEF